MGTRRWQGRAEGTTLPPSGTHSSYLGDGLVQVGEESIQGVVGDAPANRIVGNLDRAFKVCCSIVVQHSAIRLIADANLAAGIDGATCSLTLHLEHQVVWGLDLRDFNNDAVRAFETGQRRGDIGFEPTVIENFNRVATGNARLQNFRVEDRIENLLAGCFKFVTPV